MNPKRKTASIPSLAAFCHRTQVVHPVKTLRRLKWYILSHLIARFCRERAENPLRTRRINPKPKNNQHSCTGLAAKNWAAFRHRTCCKKRPAFRHRICCKQMASIPSQDLLQQKWPAFRHRTCCKNLASIPSQDLLQKIGQHSVTGLTAKKWPAFRHRT